MTYPLSQSTLALPGKLPFHMVAADCMTDGPELPMTLGEKIREARLRLHISQKELGRRMPGTVTRNAVSLWETGKNNPDSDNLFHLATILGLDLNDRDGLSMDVPIIDFARAAKLMPGERVEIWDNTPRIRATGLPAGEWIALYNERDDMNLVAMVGAIIFVNRRDTQLVSGKNFLFIDNAGMARWRQYRANPDRFEPVSSHSGNETFFPEGAVVVLGRVGRVQADV